MRSLARALILNERIQTTEAKAKELRPFIERLVTLGQENSLARRRLIMARLGGEERAAHKLVDEIAPRFSERPGGYTRVTKLGTKDGRDRALIEFVA